MIRILVKFGIVIFLCAGIALILYPNIRGAVSDFENRTMIKTVQEKQEQNRAEVEEEKEKDRLYTEMKIYNEKIFQNKQRDLKDAWSYQQSVFQLSEYGVVEEAVGYLTIESMDLQIPVYLGAGKENLDKGAAVLGETSMPVGGENTNCVIAAHRGWKGMVLFRDIEKIKIGNKVKLDNLWETLEYQVTDIRIIEPDEIEAVKIQEGKDMLTLITCHPYRYNYKRYVVFCERAQQGKELPKVDGNEESERNKEEIQTSQRVIDREIWINRLALAAITAALLFCIITTVRNRKIKRRK